MEAITGEIIKQADLVLNAYFQEGADNLEASFVGVLAGLDLMETQLRGYAGVLLIALGFHKSHGRWTRARDVPGWSASGLPFPSRAASSRPDSSHPASSRPEALRAGGSHLKSPPPLHAPHNSHTSNRSPMTPSPSSSPNNLSNEPTGPAGDAPRFDVPLSTEFIENVLSDSGLQPLPIGHMLHWDKTQKGAKYWNEDVARTQKSGLTLIRTVWNAEPNYKAAEAVRKALRRYPDLVDNAGSMTCDIAIRICELVHRGDRRSQLEMLRAMDRQREALGFCQALPHERPLIDQVAINQVFCEVVRAASLIEDVEVRRSPQFIDMWVRHIDKMERRVMRATERLVRLRKRTRQTKEVQGDLARLLRETALPPSTESASPSRWQWAPPEEYWDRAIGIQPETTEDGEIDREALQASIQERTVAPNAAPPPREDSKRENLWGPHTFYGETWDDVDAARPLTINELMFGADFQEPAYKNELRWGEDLGRPYEELDAPGGEAPLMPPSNADDPDADDPDADDPGEADPGEADPGEADPDAVDPGAVDPGAATG
jgi:hypothetical protein